MKKLLSKLYSTFGLKNTKPENIISNEPLNLKKIEQASKIIKELHSQMQDLASEGYGPFVAAVYDQNGNLIAKAANSVVNEVAVTTMLK